MMKKNFYSGIVTKLCLLVLLSSVLAFSQDAQNPNVELPDFVITGTDRVNVKSAQKIKPEIVSAVSESFLKPEYSPEELEVEDLSNPVKDEINLFDTLNFLRGNLYAGLGVYQLPTARFSYAFPFKNGIFEALASGGNRREHVEHSGKYFVNSAANLSFGIDNDSPFLPGTQFKLHGDYGLSSYKFYASADPSAKRIHQLGNVNFSASNLLSDIFIIGAKISDDFSSLQDENFSENLLHLSGFTKLELANFNLIGNLDFKNQSLKNDSITSSSYNYINLRPAVGLVFSEVLKAFFGFTYSQVEGNKFFSPYASLALRIDKNLFLYGQFAPQTEFLTAGNFLRENPYFNVQKASNVFIEKQAFLSAAVKYEYDKYVEIDAGAEYTSSDNMPYYMNSTLSGRFEIAVADARTFSGFLNLLFHPGPFGMLYSRAEISDTRDGEENYLPYHPAFKSNIIYGYNFDFGLNARTKLEFNSSSYADIRNTIKIDPYIDLGLMLAYTVADNLQLTLELSNLLGNNNYRWLRYKETPVDIVAGFNYKW